MALEVDLPARPSARIPFLYPCDSLPCAPLFCPTCPKLTVDFHATTTAVLASGCDFTHSSAGSRCPFFFSLSFVLRPPPQFYLHLQPAPMRLYNSSLSHYHYDYTLSALGLGFSLLGFSLSRSLTVRGPPSVLSSRRRYTPASAHCHCTGVRGIAKIRTPSFFSRSLALRAVAVLPGPALCRTL
jgi:hypothetical protein